MTIGGTRTPGPWKIGSKERKLNWIEITVEGDPDKNGLCWASPVAVCFGTTSPMVDTMAGACHVHANARLIAAAPELLVAVKRFMEWEYELRPNDPVRCKFPEDTCNCDTHFAHRAIAKAEGRSKE